MRHDLEEHVHERMERNALMQVTITASGVLADGAAVTGSVVVDVRDDRYTDLYEERF
jgi:hypothetical protein